MIKLKWFTINIILVSLLFMTSCKSQAPDSNENTNSKIENPLVEKVHKFYTLFETMKLGEYNCDDLNSKGTIGKEMVVEYINNEARSWSEDDWRETLYNAVKAVKMEDYYVFFIEKEVPGTSEIYINTYTLNGMRQSSILVCKNASSGEVKSRIAEDFSIFRMDDSGVSTYKINNQGKYIKVQ